MIYLSIYFFYITDFGPEWLNGEKKRIFSSVLPFFPVFDSQ